MYPVPGESISGWPSIERIFVGHRSLEVVSAFFAAVADLPGFLVVVGGDRSHRPLMAVAGNFSAVVKVVQYTELQGELVLVGSDVGSVHHQRWIAVADFEVPENLVISAVFFKDVDYVANGVTALGEFDFAGVTAEAFVFFNTFCEFRQTRLNFGYFQTSH